MGGGAKFWGGVGGLLRPGPLGQRVGGSGGVPDLEEAVGDKRRRQHTKAQPVDGGQGGGEGDGVGGAGLGGEQDPPSIGVGKVNACTTENRPWPGLIVRA